MRRTTVAARAAGRACLDARTRQRYRRRYAALLARGEAAQPPVPPVRRGVRHPRRASAQLLGRLRPDRDAVLRFIEDLTVPFDNSEAERDLRMMKVEQTVSGGFRTPAGAAAFCALRSAAELPGHGAQARRRCARSAPQCPDWRAVLPRSTSSAPQSVRHPPPSQDLGSYRARIRTTADA